MWTLYVYQVNGNKSRAFKFNDNDDNFNYDNSPFNPFYGANAIQNNFLKYITCKSVIRHKKCLI